MVVRRSESGNPFERFPSVITDQRGTYKINNMSAGIFEVQPAAPAYVATDSVGSRSKTLVLAAGENVEGLDFSLEPGGVVTGRVKVDGKSGLPRPHVKFGLVRLKGERFEPMNEPVASNSNGEFIVEGLIPGKYMTFLITEPNGDLRSEAMTFEVLNSDVEDLTVRLTKGASVSGAIVVESADPNATAKLFQMEVRGQVVSGAGPFAAGQSAISSVGPNGSFRLAGLSSGTLNLVLVDGKDQMKTNGFFIARIERDGVLQLQGVEVKEGQDVTGLRLIVGYGNASLRGVVNLDNGPLPPGGRIVVRLNKIGDPIGIRPPRIDTRGHFLIENLPGGAYELIGSVSVSGRTKQTVKRQLNLQDGSVNDVTITIDLQPSNGNTP